MADKEKRNAIARARYQAAKDASELMEEIRELRLILACIAHEKGGEILVQLWPDMNTFGGEVEMAIQVPDSGRSGKVVFRNPKTMPGLMTRRRQSHLEG